MKKFICKKTEGSFISRALSDILEELKIKQVKLSELSELPASQISNIIRGKIIPAIGTIFHICNVLHINPAIFIFKAVKERDILDWRKRQTYQEYSEFIASRFSNFQTD